MPSNQKTNVGAIIAISCIMTTLTLRVFEFRKKIIILQQEKQILQNENDSLRGNKKMTAVDYPAQNP